MRKASMNKFFKRLEDYMPIMLSVLATVFFAISSIRILDNTDGVMNAIISLTSILLGFIGVIITLLFGLSQSMILSIVFDERYNYQKRLKRFFVVSCCTGFMLLILSILMLFKNTVKSISTVWIWYILKNSFVFFFVYFLTSSFRLIYIVIELVFLACTQYDKPNDVHEENIDYTELRDKYK